MIASTKQETAEALNAPAARGQPVEAFRTAQRRVLSRYGITATSRFIDVPAIGGTAHVLVAGDGPPLIMVIGSMIPAAFWAPLMAQLRGIHPLRHGPPRVRAHRRGHVPNADHPDRR